MKNYFEAKVKTKEVNQLSGNAQVLTPSYLLRAVNYTDAETSIIKEMREVYPDFELLTLKQSNLDFVSEDKGKDKWYKAKVKVEDEKPFNEYHLINSDNIGDALLSLEKSLKECLADTTILSIAETQIMDVLLNESEDNNIITKKVLMSDYDEVYEKILAVMDEDEGNIVLNVESGDIEFYIKGSYTARYGTDNETNSAWLEECSFDFKVTTLDGNGNEVDNDFDNNTCASEIMKIS